MSSRGPPAFRKNTAVPSHQRHLTGRDVPHTVIPSGGSRGRPHRYLPRGPASQPTRPSAPPHQGGRGPGGPTTARQLPGSFRHRTPVHHDIRKKWGQRCPKVVRTKRSGAWVPPTPHAFGCLNWHSLPFPFMAVRTCAHHHRLVHTNDLALHCMSLPATKRSHISISHMP